jgi:molybdate transport system substrate-binding protein
LRRIGKIDVKIACCFAVALLLAVAGGGSAGADSLTAYAASSLREAIGDMAWDYSATHGIEIKTTFGPSRLLRERIEKGEAVDIFASADLSHPMQLKQDGRAELVALFARNAACAVSRRRLGLTTETMLDRLFDPAVKIGTSSPKADPLGDYTVELFHRADAIHPGAEKALLAKSREIFGGATNSGPVNGADPVVSHLQDGTVDVVFAYCSGRERLVSQIPDIAMTELPVRLRVGPEYGLAVLKGASAKAQNFALFMLSVDGQAILAKRGFIPVGLPQH